ncbi:MAG: histidine phosphatase family protein [Roseobacter sp.]|jgi:probable phosphoglycerate mutase
MKYPEIYILRHGQTEWNAERRLQGRLDSPLTKTGRAQARMQRAILGNLDLNGFQAFSSPQARAFHTASLALEGLFPAIHTDPRLCEIDVGRWQGKLVSELSLADLPSDDEQASLELSGSAPGGEGFAALRERCTAFLMQLSAPAVIVTHGITSRMLRLVILGLQTDEIGTLDGGQGTVFHLHDGAQSKLAIRA